MRSYPTAQAWQAAVDHALDQHVAHPISLYGRRYPKLSTKFTPLWGRRQGPLDAPRASVCASPSRRDADARSSTRSPRARPRHFLPALEPSALERQRAQNLPPGLDQIEVRGVLGLKDELPARMGQGEQQHIGGAMHVQVVDDRMDPLDLIRDPGLHLLRKSTQLAMVRPRYGAVKASPVAGWKAPKM